jgi:hypothetical protein
MMVEQVTTERPSQPYPGLRPFEANEWPIFFGRERMIDEVIERLACDRLVVIHGASGSGKSSLVRAGVMPKLTRQHQRHGAPWLTCALRPSGGPLWNLATEFAKLEGRAGDLTRIEAIHGLFNRRDATLVSIAGALEGVSGKSLCVLVDQFEELFRYEKETSREAAELFVELIGRTATTVDGKSSKNVVEVRVLVTMRSEFLGECARFDGLAETINRTQYLVPRMDDDALMRAVRRPAQMYNGSIDEALAARLIASVRGREDELPLLQHGLMLMWEEAARGKAGRPIVLDGATVEKIGGLAELLSDHADRVMDVVAPDARRVGLAEAIFRELTDVNAEGSAIRRPRALCDLAAAAGATPDELRPLINTFRAPAVSFLTPYAPAPLNEKTIVDIGHEALIRCWHRIASPKDGWLKQEFDDGLAWRSLLVEALEFDKDRRRVLPAAATEDRSKLFHARNEAWSRRYGGGWSLVGNLLEASRKAVARARLRERLGAATMAALTIGALGFAWVSWFEWDKADQNDRLQRTFVNGVLDISKARSSQVEATTQVTIEKIRIIAEQGNDVAAQMMAVIYYKGLGVARDYDSAIIWYKKAAEEKNIIAMRNLGDVYENGEGVPQDHLKAREWYEKAAAAGDAKAMSAIGILYEKGRGVPQDYDKAREWYERAFRAGDAGAAAEMGFNYSNGNGVPQDYAKAREWYEKAAIGG